jgi:hypothetical protein
MMTVKRREPGRENDGCMHSSVPVDSRIIFAQKKTTGDGRTQMMIFERPRERCERHDDDESKIWLYHKSHSL